VQINENHSIPFYGCRHIVDHGTSELDVLIPSILQTIQCEHPISDQMGASCQHDAEHPISDQMGGALRNAEQQHHHHHLILIIVQDSSLIQYHHSGLFRYLRDKFKKHARVVSLLMKDKKIDRKMSQHSLKEMQMQIDRSERVDVDADKKKRDTCRGFLYCRQIVYYFIFILDFVFYRYNCVGLIIYMHA